MPAPCIPRQKTGRPTGRFATVSRTAPSLTIPVPPRAVLRLDEVLALGQRRLLTVDRRRAGEEHPPRPRGPGGLMEAGGCVETVAVCQGQGRVAQRRRALHGGDRHLQLQQQGVCCAQHRRGRDAGARADGDACVQVFFIRHGRLIGREYFVLDGTAEETDTEVVASFVKQFYDEAAFVPPEILLPYSVEQARIIEGWLRSKRGGTVSLRVPKRGNDWDVDCSWAALYGFQAMVAAWQAPRFQADELRERAEMRLFFLSLCFLAAFGTIGDLLR